MNQNLTGISTIDVDAFAEQGYWGPVRLLTARDCRSIMRHIQHPSQPAAADWFKGHAVGSRLFYELATRPDVLEPVKAVLGDDVILWGASVVAKTPGDIHPQHVDIETSDADARTVTVWIGLENTSAQSSLHLIRGSQRFGASVQQVAHEQGRSRGEYTAEDVLQWAREREPSVSLVKLEMTNGEALWFDGHLWHGSINTGSSIRTALLLQFAAADIPIHIPDFSRLDWPFALQTVPRPASIVVSGRASPETNRLVPAPRSRGNPLPEISTWIKELQLPLDQDEERGFKAHHIFRGSTTNVEDLECHVSVLEPGTSPHPPHTHAEEELLVVLDGEAELLIGKSSERVEDVGPRDFIYYAGRQPHTIRGKGDGAVTYLMFKWRSAPVGGGELGTELYPWSETRPSDGGDGFETTRLFDGKTNYLGKLHSHITTLSPGAGYDSHVDSHDVAIVVFDGTLETLDEVVEAPAVIFASGGYPHGMHNPGKTSAQYLVFEFHRAGSGDRSRQEGILTAVRDALTQMAKTLLRRFPRVRSELKRLRGVVRSR
jgi:mannose-6-phosphate isomerase-like protein (cupin superfamily)